MTKDTRRSIENRLEAFEENATTVEFEVVHSDSDFQVITEDMTDENGNVIEEKVPDFEPPEGYEHAGVIPTESPVVTWHKLEPIDDGDDGDT
jgi:hypothetical protein